MRSPPSEWAAVLAPAFDAPCCARYHVAAPCTLAQAVADSLRVLQGPTVAPDFALYALPYGFVGVEPSLGALTTFSLYPGHRTRENAAELWAFVRTLLPEGQPIRCALYARNTPARRFLRRAGFVATDVVRHATTGRAGFIYTLFPQ